MSKPKADRLYLHCNFYNNIHSGGVSLQLTKEKRECTFFHGKWDYYLYVIDFIKGKSVRAVYSSMCKKGIKKMPPYI